MKTIRKTYLEINLNNITNNVKKIINKYNNYKYYFGVVKADSYGHCGIETIKAVIDGGTNYLAVATLEEGIQIRKNIKDIPILCLGIVPVEFIKDCIKNNITISITSLEYMKELEKIDCNNLIAHIKINTGMNRLGISSQEELEETYKLIKQKNIYIEGIYTHIYNASNSQDYMKQINKFKEITKDIELNNIKIIHISASEAIVNYSKPEFVNGCRLGIIMYGFTSDKTLRLKDTFKLYSEVIQINTLNKGDVVGYNGEYIAKESNEKIAVIPIGYADGIIRKNKGRTVYINNKEYKIVGNICMDMLFVKVDDSIKIHDKVIILKDIKHIEKVAKYLKTIPYEVICSIGKRVPRKYVKNKKGDYKYE